MAVPFVQGPTIAAGAALSDVLDCTEQAPTRIEMPPEWTAANLTFQISHDGTKFADLFDNIGNEVMVNVTPGTTARLSANWVVSPCHLRFRSGTRKNPVEQEAERVFVSALQMPAAATGGGGGEVTEPVEPGITEVAYVERRTDMWLTDNDMCVASTLALVLEPGRYSVEFYTPQLAIDPFIEVTLTLQNNGSAFGRVETKRSNFDYTTEPIKVIGTIDISVTGSHTIRALARKWGLGGAWIQGGSGGFGWFPAYLQVLKV
jgi:hypothetical protein